MKTASNLQLAIGVDHLYYYTVHVNRVLQMYIRNDFPPEYGKLAYITFKCAVSPTQTKTCPLIGRLVFYGN